MPEEQGKRENCKGNGRYAKAPDIVVHPLVDVLPARMQTTLHRVCSMGTAGVRSPLFCLALTFFMQDPAWKFNLKFISIKCLENKLPFPDFPGFHCFEPYPVKY